MRASFESALRGCVLRSRIAFSTAYASKDLPQPSAFDGISTHQNGSLLGLPAAGGGSRHYSPADDNDQNAQFVPANAGRAPS
jgi:hypothetical protein